MWDTALKNLLFKPVEFAYFEYQITLEDEGISIDKIIWFLNGMLLYFEKVSLEK